MLTRKSAEEVIKLYNALATIDSHIRAMRATNAYNNPALQKVTFYMHEAGYSGPMDYKPKHLIADISSYILDDMKAERKELVAKIEAIGFTAPQFEDKK